MSRLVTIAQASALRELGFKEECTYYAFRPSQREKYRMQQQRIVLRNINESCILAVPSVDEAIDWLRRKFNVIVFDATEPYVHPKRNLIWYSYKVKYCNVKWGWNQRERIGQSSWSNDSYAMKRQAIWIAIRYIKRKNHGQNASHSSKRSKNKKLTEM